MATHSSIPAWEIPWMEEPGNPMNCSLPGSSIHGTLQAKVLELGAIAFSRPQVKTGSEHSSTHQQKTGLKIY